MTIEAAGRDLITHADGAAEVLGEAEVRLEVGSGRVIRSLPAAPGLEGVGAGRGYRARLREQMPGQLALGTLTYCLLDDLPGVTLVGPLALSRWPHTQADFDRHRRPAAGFAGICAGWRRDGPPARRLASGDDPGQNLTPGPELTDPDDPLAWHRVPGPPAAGPMFRRRRMLDVIDGRGLLVDSLFRDSVWDPGGVELVVHEYALRAVVDKESLRLESVTAVPGVLPFGTCPAAADNVDLLVGEPLATLRHRVLELVVGTDGCTHLNDVLRALADVPVLLGQAGPKARQSR